MAHFYGEIQGTAKTIASRTGSAKSGIQAHIRGWNVGVKISCYVDEDGKDCITIYHTKGSNNPSWYIIAKFVDGEKVRICQEAITNEVAYVV